MTRSLSVSIAAMLLAAPVMGRAQTAPEPKKNETQPSQQAVTPEPKKPAGPTVQLYGTINVNTQWSRQVNASRFTSTTTTVTDVAPRLGLSNDSSNVGVRASLPVADWGKAQIQCESSAVIDGTGTNSLCNRNSQIGLSGVFGTLFIGNWDTPYKSVTYGTKADDPFGNTDVFDRAGIIGSPGFNVKSAGWKGAAATEAVATFAIRAQNSVAYWTPSFMGLSAKFQYATNEFKTQTGAISPKLYSANVVYDRGPLSVVAAYENHEYGFGLTGMNAAAVTGTAPLAAANTFGAGAAVQSATAHTEDYGWRLGAGYELKTPFGALTPSFVWETLKFMQPKTTTGIKEYGRNAWSASLKHRVGSHELRGRWDQARKGYCSLVAGACNTDGYGANQFTVGYAYYFAAPTQLYVTWTQIKNDSNAQYTFGTGGLGAVSGGGAAANVRGVTNPGQDPQALAVGLRHAF